MAQGHGGRARAPRRRRPAAWAAAGAITVVLACAGTPAAAAAAAYVDGISDQGLPAWDGSFGASYFASFFRWAWVERRPEPIALARYVVQWNVLQGGYPRYRLELDEWLRDVHSLGLVPDLALTSFDGVKPRSAAEYAAATAAVIAHAQALYPIRWLEPWNEPNDQGGYRRVREAAVPAAYANAAAPLCAAARPACSIVAGDMQDSPYAGAYLDEYRRHLAFRPAAWGVHPYYSLAERSEAPLRALEAQLPAGASVWFTEIAARRCTAFHGPPASVGEAGQAALAAWLVEDLIPRRQPAHVFYYDFLLRERRMPVCAEQREDPFLYVPSEDPSLPDAPRAAAGVVYYGRAAAAGPAPAPEGTVLDGPWEATANPLLVTVYGGSWGMGAPGPGPARTAAAQGYGSGR